MATNTPAQSDSDSPRRIAMTEDGETVHYVREKPSVSSGAVLALVAGLLSPLILAAVYFITEYTLFPRRQSNELFVYVALGIGTLGLLAGLSAKRPIAAGKERGREMADAGSGLCLLAVAACVFILWPSWTA